MLLPKNNYPKIINFNKRKYIIKYNYLNQGINLFELVKMIIIIKKFNTYKYKNLINNIIFPRIINIIFILIKHNIIDLDISPDNFMIKNINQYTKLENIILYLTKNINNCLIKIDHESTIKYEKYKSVYDYIPIKKEFIPQEMNPINMEKVIIFQLGVLYNFIFYGKIHIGNNIWKDIISKNIDWKPKKGLFYSMVICTNYMI